MVTMRISRDVDLARAQQQELQRCLIGVRAATVLGPFRIIIQESSPANDYQPRSDLLSNHQEFALQWHVTRPSAFTTRRI